MFDSGYPENDLGKFFGPKKWFDPLTILSEVEGATGDDSCILYYFALSLFRIQLCLPR